MKLPQTEVCWSDEDLAYVAWVPGRPGCRALGESPTQALARLEKLDRQEARDSGAPETTPPVPEVPVKRREALRMTRLEAASRQLDGAIALFFAGGEPLAVHALATAAGELFADRVARWSGGASDDCLPRQDYLRLLQQARVLCRAVGGEEPLAWECDRNDALIAQAIADRLAVCPSRPLSADMALFRDWYRAARAPDALAEAPSVLPSRRRPPRRPPSDPAHQFSLLPETL
jgi:hypothetical protein